VSKSESLQKLYDLYFDNLEKSYNLDKLSESLNLDEDKNIESAKTRTIIIHNDEEEEE
jgi:hypothetical protein